MRRAFFVPGLLAIWLAAGEAAPAQSIPHLELVRGLRQQGMPDLALEYLDKLRARKLPDVEPLLPLEYARTRLELAADEPDAGKRDALLTQARGEFIQFTQKNPNHPLAPSANIDLARLVSLQGKGQLAKARRSENKETEKKEKVVARGYFQQAAKGFADAAKALDDKIKALDDKKDAAVKKDLEQTKTRAMLGQGINLYDMAQTFELEGKDLIQRGETMKQAVKLFESMLADEEKPPAAWVAHAWLAQCLWEMDDKGKAEGEFTAILKERSPAAQAGVRLVRAFRVEHAFLGEGGAKGNRYANARAAAEAWLRDYGSARNTPEGMKVRFIYARAAHGEAEAGIKRDKDGKPVGITGGAEQLLKMAERVYKDLSESDNEYTERATRSRMSIILVRSEAQNRGEPQPKDMKTFEEAYLQALVQQAKLNDLAARAGGDPELARRLKDEEPKRQQASVAFLHRALELVKPKDDAREVLDARALLAYAYQLAGEHEKSGDLAEKLMRENPKSRHAPMMGALAVNEAVIRLNGLRQEEGDKEKEKQAQALTAKVKELAAHLEKTWPTDAATDTARHTLGYLLRYERDFLGALQVYSRIQPAYAGLAQARLEQGAALYRLMRGEGTSAAAVADHVATMQKKHAQLWADTVRALEALPEPVPTASLADAQAYVNAKVQLGQLYLLGGKQYDRAERIGQALQQAIPKFSQLAGDDRQHALYAAKALQLSGVEGQGFVLAKGEKYDDAAKLLDPVVAEIKADLAKPSGDQSPAFGNLRRAQRDVITVALRNSVSGGKIDRARELLDLLDKSGSGVEGSVAVLRSLVGTVRTQIEELRREKKDAEAKKLISGFSQFLDAIAKQEKIPENLLLFLAQGYGGVDQHAKAAELLERILNAPAAKKEEDPEAARRFRHQVQFLLARSYRQSKEFDKADKVLKELLGTAKARGPLFSSMEVRKESFYLLEDQNKFRDAVSAWTAYANQFGQKLPPHPPANQQDANRRRMYFDLFFEAQRCSAKAYFSLDAQKYGPQKEEGFDRVAGRLVDLESKNPDLSPELKERIRDTLAEYPPLADKYKAKGGKLLDAPGEAPAGTGS